jgi:hypothetical protein
LIGLNATSAARAMVNIGRRQENFMGVVGSWEAGA